MVNGNHWGSKACADIIVSLGWWSVSPLIVCLFQCYSLWTSHPHLSLSFWRCPPWTAGRSNQSILKEIGPGCSLEGLMLKLKLQYYAKSWLIGKGPDAGRDWGQEEKGMTEDEMVGWHHWLNGHEFEWTPGVCDGQGGLACCDSGGHKESDTTEQLN